MSNLSLPFEFLQLSQIFFPLSSTEIISALSYQCCCQPLSSMQGHPIHCIMHRYTLTHSSQPLLSKAHVRCSNLHKHTQTHLPHRSTQHPCGEQIPSTTTSRYLDPQSGNFQHYRLLHGQDLPSFVDARSHKEMKGGLLQHVTHVLARFDHNVERAGWRETQERKKASEGI